MIGVKYYTVPVYARNALEVIAELEDEPQFMGICTLPIPSCPQAIEVAKLEALGDLFDELVRYDTVEVAA